MVITAINVSLIFLPCLILSYFCYSPQSVFAIWTLDLFSLASAGYQPWGNAWFCYSFSKCHCWWWQLILPPAPYLAFHLHLVYYRKISNGCINKYSYILVLYNPLISRSSLLCLLLTHTHMKKTNIVNSFQRHCDLSWGNVSIWVFSILLLVLLFLWSPYFRQCH